LEILFWHYTEYTLLSGAKNTDKTPWPILFPARGLPRDFDKSKLEGAEFDQSYLTLKEMLEIHNDPMVQQCTKTYHPNVKRGSPLGAPIEYLQQLAVKHHVNEDNFRIVFGNMTPLWIDGINIYGHDVNW